MWFNWRFATLGALSWLLGLTVFAGLTGLTSGWPPPPKWAQADALAVVQFTSDPTQVCRQAGGKDRRDAACGARGWAILPNPCIWPGNESFARLACHELGRVNGYLAP